MTLSIKEKKVFSRNAKNYINLREELDRKILENARYVKTQLADWYIAIAAVCFAVGGVAISSGKGGISHPALFWWGSVLLIANGVLIFFARKTELESEDRGFTPLKQSVAHLWTMSKVASEHATGDESRKADLAESTKFFKEGYDKQTSPWKWYQWVWFVTRSSLLDVVFGVFFFALLMLAPQLPNYLHITFRVYSTTMWALLISYIIYVAVQIALLVKNEKALIRAEQQIKKEISKVD